MHQIRFAHVLSAILMIGLLGARPTHASEVETATASQAANRYVPLGVVRTTSDYSLAMFIDQQTQLVISCSANSGGVTGPCQATKIPVAATN